MEKVCEQVYRGVSTTFLDKTTETHGGRKHENQAQIKICNSLTELLPTIVEGRYSQIHTSFALESFAPKTWHQKPAAVACQHSSASSPRAFGLEGGGNEDGMMEDKLKCDKVKRGKRKVTNEEKPTLKEICKK